MPEPSKIVNQWVDTYKTRPVDPPWWRLPVIIGFVLGVGVALFRYVFLF